MADLTRIGTRAFRVEARTIHDVFDLIESIEVPVIAAFDGVAAGGGFELALSCDFRILGEKARLVMPEARVGLIPGSGGCSRLVRHIGLGRAKELVMLGATIPAARALELGLATEVVADGGALAAAHALAERLMTLAPLAVGMAKVVLNTCNRRRRRDRAPAGTAGAEHAQAHPRPRGGRRRVRREAAPEVDRAVAQARRREE